MKKEWIKVIIYGLLSGLLSALLNEFITEDVMLSFLIKTIAFGDFQIGFAGMHLFLLRYVPHMIFQVLWGTYLYKHFCTASVYFFSRIQDRGKWYFKEAGKLLGYTFLYQASLIVSCVAVSAIEKQIVVDDVGIMLMLYYWLLQSLWTFLVTLLINILAICFGSGNGFLIVSTVELALLGYYVALQKVLDFSIVEILTKEQLRVKSFLIRINPLSHLILQWHGSRDKDMNAIINVLPIEFPLVNSVVLFIIMNLVILGIGIRIVKKREFIISNQETGGNS